MKRAIWFTGAISAVVAITVVSVDRAGMLEDKVTSQNTVAAASRTYQPLQTSQLNTLIADANTPPLSQARELPRSLVGLNTPQSPDIDVHGNLVVNAKVIKLFDFYLSAIGEEPIENIIDRVKQQLSHGLPEVASSQALTLFENYLHYLNQLTELKSTYDEAPQSVDTISDAQAHVFELRAQYFSTQQIEAFWGRQDQYERYMLAMVKIKSDEGMSLQQKAQALDDLAGNAPVWLLTQRQQTTQLNDYRERYQTLKNRGAGREELVELIYQQFDEQAAQRMIDLQQHRTQWQQRLSQYRRELDLLLAVEESSVVRDEQVAILRQQYFSPNELKRISALDDANNKF